MCDCVKITMILFCLPGVKVKASNDTNANTLCDAVTIKGWCMTTWAVFCITFANASAYLSHGGAFCSNPSNSSLTYVKVETEQLGKTLCESIKDTDTRVILQERMSSSSLWNNLGDSAAPLQTSSVYSHQLVITLWYFFHSLDTLKVSDKQSYSKFCSSVLNQEKWETLFLLHLLWY